MFLRIIIKFPRSEKPFGIPDNTVRISHEKRFLLILTNLLSEYCPGGLMTTSLNEEAVQRNESLERDPAIVYSIRTVLLHHSLSQDIREVIRGY
jgi:hypothetical protein